MSYYYWDDGYSNLDYGKYRYRAVKRRRAAKLAVARSVSLRERESITRKRPPTPVFLRPARHVCCMHHG